MAKRINYGRDFWLTIVSGGLLVVLVIALSISFFRAISDAETKSRKQFLWKQTELAATEIEIEINRFGEDAKELINFLDDEDLDEEDYREEFTTIARRVFNRYPGLIDTVWVDLQDSLIYLTKTERNDFIRNRVSGDIPLKTEGDFLYYLNGENSGFELTFSLNPVRFTKGFVTHYYLNNGGSKLLRLGEEIESLESEQNSSPIEIEEAAFQQVQRDMESGVIGIYELEWDNGDASRVGILVQYPFHFGEIYKDASLIFMIESESITDGVYSTYLYLFCGFAILLMGTVVFFTISLQNNMESQRLQEESAAEIAELFDQQNLLLKELRGFVYFHNYKGEITRVSDEVEEILGNPKAEFLAAFKGDGEQEDALRVRDLVKTALGQNKSFIDLEYDYIKPNGRQVRLRVFEKLVFDDRGRFNGGLGIATDITDQYQSKQELIESGKRLQNLIDNIPDIIFTYDNDGIVLDSHAKEQKFLKPQNHRLLGKSLFKLVPKKQREQTLFAFNLARKTGQIQTVDLMFTSDSENQYFEVRFFPLDSRHMMSISKDITTQRIWEKGLVEAMNAADQASKAKSDFLANMSHEIRTPMNGLLGIIDLLDQTTLDAEQLEYLEIIKNSGNSLLNIIKDILDYSKIEAGKININSMVFSPAEEIEKQLQIFYGLAQKKGVTLTTQYEAETFELMEGDLEKINQVILNLVGNAMKFTSKGGTVLVRLELENISGDINYLKCSVEDNGVGIPLEEIPKLTDPFYQVESSSSRTYQGTGLGLAIAKKIIELMGGELSITSELGVGATFTFSVILNKASKDNSGYAYDGPLKRTNWNGMAADYPARILLAEDNELNLQLMKLMLDQLGYDFEVAKNGWEALDLVRSKEFDLILMDVQMPLLNGLEASRKIRELGEKGNVFIIGLSANVFDEDQKKATEAGMNDYLTKPIRLVALAEKLKEFCVKLNAK